MMEKIREDKSKILKPKEQLDSLLLSKILQNKTRQVKSSQVIFFGLFAKWRDVRREHFKKMYV